MKLETFTGSSVPELLAQASNVFGTDAVLLSVKRLEGPVSGFEIVAASGEEPLVAAPARGAATPSVESESVWPGRRSSLLGLGRSAPAARPRVIALVGPTGAGKTTTLAKLAGNPAAFGGQRVAVISLDVFRIGAVEQLRAHARMLGVPVAVVYGEDEARRALRRFRRFDVVLVDTPGRGPREQEDARAVHEVVESLAPDEVHLVLPAGVSPGLAWRVVQDALPMGVTHLLPTKLDEFPDSETLRALAQHMGLGVRWMAEGQRVPTDLRVIAAPRGPSLRARWPSESGDTRDDLSMTAGLTGRC